MGFRRSVMVAVLYLALGLGAGDRTWAQDAAIPSSFDALVAAAQKEGRVDLTWSETVLGGSDVVQQFEASFNALYKTRIALHYTPGPEMARLANQLATEFDARQTASSDVYIGAAPQTLALLKRNVLQPVPWTALDPSRITPQEVEQDGKLLRIQTAISGIPYNTDLIKTPPSTLMDFLKPEWKGKLATTPYAGGYDILAANDIWGPKRALDFVTKLSAQVSGLIRCGDMERVATGEFQAFVMDCISNPASLWQERGAPVGYIIPTDAAQRRFYYIAVPRNASHPAAATLFGLYLDSAEGQKLMWQTNRIDLDSFKGSRMAELIKQTEAKGVVFKEVTVAWWDQHPEIDQTKAEMIKIISRK